MAQEKIERLRSSYELFSRTGGYDVDRLAPDFEVHQASSIIDTAGVFRGDDSLRDVLRELHEAFEELAFEAERIVEAPGGELVAFIHVRGRGRSSGLELDNRIAHVWTYRGDDAVRLVIYEEQADALEAVGLS